MENSCELSYDGLRSRIDFYPKLSQTHLYYMSEYTHAQNAHDKLKCKSVLDNHLTY